MTDQRPEAQAPDAMPMSMRSLALFVLGPLLFFLPAAYAVVGAVFWQLRTGGMQPASEGFFWISTAVIPLALFLATWLLPRRISASGRAMRVNTSGHIAPLAFYDDVRLGLAWSGCVVFAIAALIGLAGSGLALRNCADALGTCGTVMSHRLAIYGIVAAVSELIALAGVRLVVRASVSDRQ